MPFETFAPSTRRIAVIGGGISGLAAAHLLAQDHAVVLFEADKRLGGHAHTVMAGKRGDQPVDMGFIVFNRVNYPNLSALFGKLEVPVAESAMSFGASIGGGWLEYGLANPGALLAKRSNLLRPGFGRMLLDILRFNRRAEGVLRSGMTLRDLLAALGTSGWFRDYYITPFTGAIWSTPVQGILDFPAHPMVQFFKNHGLMAVSGQHQWETVRGGSVEYVRRLSARLERQGAELRLGAQVAGVRRVPGGAMIRAAGGEWEMFDEVIFACHSDQALALLTDASEDERRNLAAICYQANEAVLHSDASLMPRAKRAWSSWNYVEAAGARPEKIALTYWMNSLQPIPQDDPMFVTLNPVKPVDPRRIMRQETFYHPVFDLGAMAAQARLRAMNGARATWFAGAWMRNGFHEDGFVSALDVVGGVQARAQAREAA
jgi:hypothetical protein